MATSGTIRPSSNGILVSWSLGEQSVGGNYSVVNISVGWSFQSSPTDRQLDNGLLQVNGQTLWDVPGRVKNYTGSSGAHDYWAWAGYIVIGHDGSGNANVNVYAEMTGYSGAFSSGSGSWALPQIPRLPSQPGTPTVTGHQDSDPTTATFTWTAPSDVGAGLQDRRFIITTRADGSDQFPLVFDSVASWSTSVNATGLPKGTQLYARVAASSSAGYGGYSGILSFVTGITVPGTPDAPTFTNISGSGVTVNWTPPADGGGSPSEGYDIQRATNSGFSSNVVNASVPAGSTSLNVTGLAHNTTYYYRIRKRNAAGASSYSAGASFTTTTTAPTAPATGPSVSSRNNVSITVTWTAPSDNGGSAITGYEVQWATESTFASPGTITSATTSRTITALVPATAYYVRVRAVNAAGSGAWSATLNTRTTSGVKLGNGTSFAEVDIWICTDGSSWRSARLWTPNGSTWQ